MLLSPHTVFSQLPQGADSEQRIMCWWLIWEVIQESLVGEWGGKEMQMWYVNKQVVFMVNQLKEVKYMKWVVGFYPQVPGPFVIGQPLGILTPNSPGLFHCPQEKTKPRQFYDSHGHIGYIT